MGLGRAGASSTTGGSALRRSRSRPARRLPPLGRRSRLPALGSASACTGRSASRRTPANTGPNAAIHDRRRAMKTRHDVEVLKAGWLRDPCWDAAPCRAAALDQRPQRRSLARADRTPGAVARRRHRERERRRAGEGEEAPPRPATDPCIMPAKILQAGEEPNGTLACRDACRSIGNVHAISSSSRPRVSCT